MMDYFEARKIVVQFLNENRITAFDLVNIAKDLCRCRTCRFFVQHYDKDGDPVDFGHCIKNNNPRPRPRSPNMESCGFWTIDASVRNRR